MAGKDDKRTRQILKKVVGICNLCRQFKKTPPRPRVAMPKAVSVNEVVSLDLKEKRECKKHILYGICEFSSFMFGEVIKDKNPSTIIKAFNK